MLRSRRVVRAAFSNPPRLLLRTYPQSVKARAGDAILSDWCHGRIAPAKWKVAMNTIEINTGLHGLKIWRQIYRERVALQIAAEARSAINSCRSEIGREAGRERVGRNV